MKLDKAIEIGKDIIHYVEPGDAPDEHDALKLLVEAGKAINALRQGSPGLNLSTLPGETKD